jgi:hypothetical protein
LYYVKYGTRHFHSAREARPKFVAPAPDRFIAHDNAAFEQQLFDVAKAQLEAKMPAHSAADSGGRKAMTVIERFRFLHRIILNDSPSNVTVP